MPNNRLQIKPLVENYMDVLEDSEHTISQITGHVTIRNEKEYISKTKELQVAIIDDKLMKEDLTNKVNEDKELAKGITDKIQDLEDMITEIESTMNEMKSKLDIYEEKVEKIEEDLIEIDSYIRNELLVKIQELFSSRINGNLEHLISLLINAERLDIIIDNKEYFENVLSVAFNYVDIEGIVHNYETVKLHNSNMKLIDTLVDRKVYDAFVKDLNAKYSALKTKYNLTGDYKITGAV